MGNTEMSLISKDNKTLFCFNTVYGIDLVDISNPRNPKKFDNIVTDGYAMKGRLINYSRD